MSTEISVVQRPSRTKRLVGVQTLRLLAAGLVVGTHSTLYVHDRLDRSMAVWHFGEAGVDIFFVISGLVMMVSSASLRDREDGWKYFAARRVIRIVPIYWLATTVKLVTLIASPGEVLHAHLGFRTVALSYLFLPSTNSDGVVEPLLSVGWTLTFEMFFYAVFALALYLRTDLVRFCGVVLTALAIGSVFRSESWPAALVYVHPRVLYFLAGMMIGRFILDRRTRSLVAGLAFVIAVYLGVEIAVAVRQDSFSLWNDALRHVMAIGIVLLAVVFEDRLRRGVSVLSYLGDASYSLYLFHPIVSPLAPAVLLHLSIHSDALSIALSMLGALVVSVVIYRWVESPTTAWLRRCLPYAGGFIRQGSPPKATNDELPAKLSEHQSTVVNRDSGPRSVAIDAVRVLGILAVIYGHVWTTGRLNAVIYAWHVPLFFFLTGWLWKDGRSFASEAANRIRTLLVPYAGWLFVIGVVVVLRTAHSGGSVASQIRFMLYGGHYLVRPFSAFWFVSALFVACLLRRAVDRMPFVVITVLAAGAFAVVSTFPHPLARTPGDAGLALAGVAFMVAGEWARRLTGSLARVQAGLLGPLLVASGLLVVVSTPIGRLDLKQGELGTPGLSAALAVVICVGLVLTAQAVEVFWPKRVRSVITALASVGLTVVLSHAVVLWVLNTPTSGRDLDAVLAVVVPWALALAVLRTPLSRVLVAWPAPGPRQVGRHVSSRRADEGASTSGADGLAVTAANQVVRAPLRVDL